MSPLPQTVTAFVGAAVLGAVSAAAVYVFQHYQQEKNRHAMAQDLVRLNSELTKVRKELEKLMQKQSERYVFIYQICICIFLFIIIDR